MPGPASVKRRLIDEMRDHLYEDIDSLGSSSDPAEIADRAIVSFGPAETVVDEMDRELARWRTARSALVLLVGTIAFAALWVGILTTGPADPWTERLEPLGLVWAESLAPLTMSFALIAVVLANVLYWLPIRTRSVNPTLRRGPELAVLACRVGIVTFACSLASIVTYVVMRIYLAPRSLEWLDIAFGITLSLAAIAALVAMSRSLRSIRVAILPPRLEREAIGPSW